MTAVNQHIINTIDYIHGSLLVHYIHDNTKMSELARGATVAPHHVYFWIVIIANIHYIIIL